MALTQLTPPESRIAIRVHRMRLARGACWVIAFALLSASVLTSIDALVRLSSWVRGISLAIWLTGFGVLAWLFVVKRLSGERYRNAARVAAKELPENIRASTAAAIAIVSCLLGAVLVPNATEHIRRIAVPWYQPAASLYRVVVTSRDSLVWSGDSVTLSAYAEKLDAGVPNAENALLVCRDSAGNELSFRMILDGAGAFHATYPTVNADFAYRVEIEDATSDWYVVTAILPVEPTLQSLLEIAPPRYAVGCIPLQTVAGFTSFSGHQFGKVELNFKFSRPAVKASLLLRPEPAGTGEIIPIALSSDSLSGTAALTLKQDGTLRLVTVAEQGGNTLSSPDKKPYTINIRVIPDTPPRFERIRGVSSRTISIRPGQTLPIEVAAVDDIAIGNAVIEYSIGGNEAQSATLSFSHTGPSAPRFVGRMDFDLPGKLREGETVKYRIRVSDTRWLSDPELKPHEIVYPKVGWASVRVSPLAPPIELQEIEGQRDAVGRGLDSTLQELMALIAELKSLRSETSSRFELHHQILLDKLRERVQVIGTHFVELSQETALTDELQRFASMLVSVADRDLRDAEDQLRYGVADRASGRDQALAAALKHLTTACARIEQLRIRNVEEAQVRIDCKQIESLIAEQLHLIVRVKTDAKIPPAELLRLQKELSSRLAKIIAESAPLRSAMEEAKKNEVIGFARQISALATMLQDLDIAMKQHEEEVLRGILASRAGEMSANSVNTGTLLGKIELATRLAGVNPPKPEEFARVEKLIAAGKTVESLTELQRLNAALETVAIPLEKWTYDREDPKVACRQFANWQEDLRTRFKNATGGIDANFKNLLHRIKTDFLNEQKAISSALAGLALPANRDLAALSDSARKYAQQAEECLVGTGVDAGAAMKETLNALNRMADRIPSIPERIVQARPEIEELLKEQEHLLSNLKAAAKAELTTPDPSPTLAKKLAPLAARQRAQLARFTALDLPGMSVRRTRILAALAAAVADMEAVLPLEAVASLNWATRELDRAKLVLDRNSPPEEKVDALVRRLEETLASFEKAATVLNNEYVISLQEIQKQLTQVTLAEAPALKNKALDAIRTAENLFHNGTKAESRPSGLKLAVALVRKRGALRAAIATIRNLSDRLVGNESELEHIQRLVWYRHLAAERAEELKSTKENRAESDEAKRQLMREVDELLSTRVGGVGQFLKQRALDQYEKLRGLGEPDHAAGLQKNLVNTLNELAGMMTEAKELTATFDRSPPIPVATEVDNYLLSKRHIEELRDQARDQRQLRERLSHLSDELTTKLQAEKDNPLFSKQLNKIDELIREADELAAALQCAELERGLDDLAALA